mgnify:CR=1 FL=1|jgi:hypothetical protein
MENKVEITFSRQEVQNYLPANTVMTDQQWLVMASELESAFDNIFPEEVRILWQQIDEIVAEDIKSSSQLPN